MNKVNKNDFEFPSFSYPGFYISIEGIDGSGSTTHAKLVTEWLKNTMNESKVILIQEPSTGEIGQLIRMFLKKTDHHAEIDALLFAADRTEQFYSITLPHLMKNHIVVSDRCKISSILYQSQQSLPQRWIEIINYHIPFPDLTIILDCSAETALKRKLKMTNNDSINLEKFEKINFLKPLRQKYLEYAKKHRLPIISTENKTIEESQKEIQRVVEEKIKKWKRIK